jgi:hypothetical protein
MAGNDGAALSRERIRNGRGDVKSILAVLFATDVVIAENKKR